MSKSLKCVKIVLIVVGIIDELLEMGEICIVQQVVDVVGCVVD